jgi:hypothetical protein
MIILKNMVAEDKKLRFRKTEEHIGKSYRLMLISL